MEKKEKQEESKEGKHDWENHRTTHDIYFKQVNLGSRFYGLKFK